jgi:rare lipoprotein A
MKETALNHERTEKWIEHTVQKGDTLWELAHQRYHVSLEDMINDNNIADPKKLKPGQKLRIRFSEPFSTQNNGAVSPDGTAEKKQDLQTQKNLSLNRSWPLAGEKQVLIPGHKNQTENMAADGSECYQCIEHIIKPGETLWSLAVKRYHVNLEDIIRDNNIRDPKKIQPGQTIQIRKKVNEPVREVVASWYGEQFHGRPMANGDTFDMFAETLAHKKLPFGTRVELTNPDTGEKVTSIVTDRGPYIEGRDIDLSFGLARKLSLVEKGVGKLKMKIL